MIDGCNGGGGTDYEIKVSNYTLEVGWGGGWFLLTGGGGGACCLLNTAGGGGSFLA
jgi:hypothetical protein